MSGWSFLQVLLAVLAGLVAFFGLAPAHTALWKALFALLAVLSITSIMLDRRESRGH